MSSDDLPAPCAALFPDVATRRRVEDLLTGELLRATERVVCGPVMPTLDRAALRAELARFDFQTPRPIEELLAWAIAKMEVGVVHMNNPRYFGLFNPSPTFPAQCADRIAGAFNPQLASSGSSPAPIEIEAHVIRTMAQRAGLPTEAGGHFTVSGAEANFTSLVCAMTRAEPRFGLDGVRAFSGPVAFYASQASHQTWYKIAHQAGVGRSALRLVATDGKGRMDPHALEQALRSDRAQGLVPVLVAATAGTTTAGMIDPLAKCGEIARANGLWYHVDAAWGGAALASERLRELLGGIELADSITIDAHKWFATTMGCGMFLTRHPKLLSETFRTTTSFMPSELTGLDPYLNSVQWSRRFMGLRLFLALGAAGWSGYAAHVERATAVTGYIRHRLLERGWTVANDSPLAVLCVLPPPGSVAVREIVQRVLATGQAWVAPAAFEGRDVVRICATHGETSRQDTDVLVNALQQAAR